MKYRRLLIILFCNLFVESSYSNSFQENSVDIKQYYLTGSHQLDCKISEDGCNPKTKKRQVNFKIYNNYAYIEEELDSGEKYFEPFNKEVILKTDKNSLIKICPANNECNPGDVEWDYIEIADFNILSNQSNFFKNEKKLNLKDDKDYCAAMSFHRGIKWMAKTIPISYGEINSLSDYASMIFTINQGYIGIVSKDSGLPLRNGYYLYNKKTEKLLWQTSRPKENEGSFWINVNKCKIEKIHYEKLSDNFINKSG